jgi:sarcosine dehydrogenase
VREAAVIFDQTSFAKFVLKGRDAEAALSWIASNDVAKPVGSLIYTQMLNDKGGIECDDLRAHCRRRILHRHRHRLCNA